MILISDLNSTLIQGEAARGNWYAAGQAEAAAGRALPQGRQLAGLLQRQAGIGRHAADQGEGRQEEIRNERFWPHLFYIFHFWMECTN